MLPLVCSAKVERCAGAFCVSANENFFQFEKKWNAHRAPAAIQEKGSYPKLCLWDKRSGISYVFEFIGTYGTNDQPLKQTRLGSMEISKSDICKSARAGAVVALNAESKLLGLPIQEVVARKGLASRIDEVDEKLLVSLTPQRTAQIRKRYFHFLHPENELLTNIYDADATGKIMRVVISELP